MDKQNRLDEMDKVLAVAKQIGCNAFKGERFKIKEVHGRFEYGFIAVYAFERNVVPMRGGNGKKT